MRNLGRFKIGFVNLKQKLIKGSSSMGQKLAMITAVKSAVITQTVNETI